MHLKPFKYNNTDSQLTKTLFMRQSQPPDLSSLRKVWEEDLGGGIDEKIWKKITGSWYKISREIQTKLIMYKIIYRIYWTPCKMSRLTLCDTDLCWRCNRSEGALLDMFNNCYWNQNVWKNVIGCINKILNTKFVINLALCVLVQWGREQI